MATKSVMNWLSRRNTLKANAIFYQEGECWIGQVLEYDITVQAKALPDLMESLKTKITAELEISENLGENLLTAIGPAPQQFWDMFHRARMKVEEPQTIKVNQNNLRQQFVPCIKIGKDLEMATA